jgi:hypothetical protein
MGIVNSSRGFADKFDRLDNGQINFTGLDKRLLAVETRNGSRYLGVVSQGEEGKWVLYTGFLVEMDS